jgi:hypothetical protein
LGIVTTSSISIDHEDVGNVALIGLPAGNTAQACPAEISAAAKASIQHVARMALNLFRGVTQGAKMRLGQNSIIIGGGKISRSIA